MSVKPDRASTIRDVAMRAGVAVSTVSRVLSEGYCSEETRARVNQAIAELDYRPNQLARSLVRKESRTIGLVIPDITNPFFPGLTRGVEDKARELGYAVLLANTDGDLTTEERVIQALLSKQVDGLIVTTAGHGPASLPAVARKRVPLVVMDRHLASTHGHSVVVDNVGGARLAVEHLLALGHRRIAYIGGTPGVGTHEERLAGYFSALQAAGLPAEQELLQHGGFKYEGGYTAMRDLVASGCTALFAANDLMALGALKAIREAGLRVPEDISVVGFDDIPIAQMAFPPLTTIRQPAYELGAKAAEMLVSMKSGHPLPPGQRAIVWQLELIQRESTAPVMSSNRG